MLLNVSALNNSLHIPKELLLDRPPWVATALAAILIFTIIVDILGNLLVILSVFRNRKLRNAGKELTPSPIALGYCAELTPSHDPPLHVYFN